VGLRQHIGWGLHRLFTNHLAFRFVFAYPMADDCDRCNIQCLTRPSSSGSRGAWMPSTRCARRSRWGQSCLVALSQKLGSSSFGFFSDPIMRLHALAIGLPLAISGRGIKSSFCHRFHRKSVGCSQIIAFVRPLFAWRFSIVRESMIHSVASS